MGELLNRWIAGLACYYLVYAIVMNVIPRKEYRVYVKTFMGLLLIVLLPSHPSWPYQTAGTEFRFLFTLSLFGTFMISRT